MTEAGGHRCGSCLEWVTGSHVCSHGRPPAENLRSSVALERIAAALERIARQPKKGAP